MREGRTLGRDTVTEIPVISQRWHALLVDNGRKFHAAAKLRLFTEVVAAGGVAVVNSDAEHSDAFIAAARKRGLTLLTVGETEDMSYSRMTITVRGEPEIIEALKQGLRRFVNVIKVLDFTGVAHKRCLIAWQSATIRNPFEIILSASALSTSRSTDEYLALSLPTEPNFDLKV